MIFTYKQWDAFCENLKRNRLHSMPARSVVPDSGRYLVLKHDVETNVPSAYHMARIEAKHGHKGSYYVQAYLLDDPTNVDLLQEMQKLGHEISYHYDVMDSNQGNLGRAIEEFARNLALFEANGFRIQTVCQHGNPIVERVGYTSNRDFFRSAQVQCLYPEIADVMVNYPEKYQTQYKYFSDAGRLFKHIYDPINNDITNSSDRNIPYKDLEALFGALDKNVGNIISIHPHRWTASAGKYIIKSAAFKIAKFVARLLMKIPFINKLMGRFYYLAKKF